MFRQVEGRLLQIACADWQGGECRYPRPLGYLQTVRGWYKWGYWNGPLFSGSIDPFRARLRRCG